MAPKPKEGGVLGGCTAGNDVSVPLSAARRSATAGKTPEAPLPGGVRDLCLFKTGQVFRM